MTNTHLALLYLIGGLACFYLGMRFDSYLWRKRYVKRLEERIQKAYDRGWDSGFGYLNRISEARTELESSVRILE